jgi:ribose transport system substrate-binding protein
MALLALTTLLVGCDPNKASDTTEASGQQPSGAPRPPVAEAGADAPKFKILTNNSSPFWSAMAKGLDDVKAEIKVNGDWQAPTPPEHNAQVTLMKEAIAAKFDGIAITPIKPDAMAPTIDEAIAANIPVITYDSDSPTSKRLAYIGTNNYEAGKILGQEAINLFPNGGRLIAFVGEIGAQNARDRYQGFQDAIKGTKIEFIQEPFEDKADRSRARSNVEDAITRYQGKVDGFVGLWSYNGPAIAAAVTARNLRPKIKILCFDGDPETLRNLEQGNIDVTVVQKPYEFGRLTIKLLYQYKKTGDIQKAIEALKSELDALGMKVNGVTIDTGVTVVTPQNAATFIQELKKKGLETT